MRTLIPMVMTKSNNLIAQASVRFGLANGIENFRRYNKLTDVGAKVDYFRAITSALTNSYYKPSKTYIRIRLLV